MSTSASKRKLQEQLDAKSDEMEKKSQQIKKLKSYLKKVRQGLLDPVVVFRSNSCKSV